MTPPSFDSDLLRARSPPQVSFIPVEFRSTDPLPAACPALPVTVSASVTTKFKLSRQQMCSLKVPPDGRNNGTRPVSSFSIMAALVWKCYCISTGFAPSTQSRLAFSADIRRRLSPPLLKTYFGNAVVRNCATSEVSKIIQPNSVHAVAEIVQAAVDGITEEVIRSVIDYFEVMRTKISLRPEKLESDLIMVSISGFPVYEADFGWGAPQKMSRAEVGGVNGVHVQDEPGIDGGWQLNVTLDASVMPRFQKAFSEELALTATGK